MIKHKKFKIFAIIFCCTVLLGIGIYFGIRIYSENQIHFTVNDTLPDGQGKKATVILLAGQSNASGCSLDEYLQKNVSAEQYETYENGFENVYINYYVSGAHASDGFVPCSVKQGEIGGFFGPELGMAEKLAEMYPDELFFIIKYTWSGTNLYEQWLSPSSEGKTGNLYQAFIPYVETSVEYLISKDYDVEIKGMCWMQGESDSFSVENATNYKENLTNFIGDIRKKFARYAADDGIYFIDAYIADNPVYWVYCDIVNEKKREVASASPLNALVDTIANGLTCSEEPENSPDLAHYDSLSELKLGHLFIEELAKLLEP